MPSEENSQPIFSTDIIATDDDGNVAHSAESIIEDNVNALPNAEPTIHEFPNPDAPSPSSKFTEKFKELLSMDPPPE